MAYCCFSGEEGEENGEAWAETRDFVTVGREKRSRWWLYTRRGKPRGEIVECLNMIGTNPHDIAAILSPSTRPAPSTVSWRIQ